MIKAELSYNPYLMETIILFNGNTPKINSLVEKHLQEKLQSWINEIPGIFYDEMNGYDFELEFSGTDVDYEELVQAFKKAGVTEKKVRILHKANLEGRMCKKEETEKIIQWLKNTPNRQFDYGAFETENEELYDKSYQMIIVQGNNLSVGNSSQMMIDAVYIESIDEIRSIDLTNTPIIFFLDRETIKHLQMNIMNLVNRSDVITEQLFFVMDDSIKAEKAIRIIEDLGIEEPKIIVATDDDSVKRYLEIYAVADYIEEAIKRFRSQYVSIDEKLQNDKEKNEILNSEVHRKITNLEDRILNLETAERKFLLKEELCDLDEFQYAKEKMFKAISSWKKTKLKTTKNGEAEKEATNLDSCISKAYTDFLTSVNSAFDCFVTKIDQDTKNWYLTGNFDLDYIAKVQMNQCTLPEINPIRDILLDKKQEKFVEKKEEFLGRLLKTQNSDEKELVLEVTHNYQEWRKYATTMMEEIIDQVIKMKRSQYDQYYHDIAENYQSHLRNMINASVKEKEESYQNLSEDEKLIQEDCDWLETFNNLLTEIERA